MTARSLGSNKREEVEKAFSSPTFEDKVKKQEKDISLQEYAKTISDLSKAKLSALVVSTCSFGFLAAAEPISYSTLAAASLGTALCSSSASTLNQIFEQDRDARMKRTAHRPLVTKKIVGNNGAYALATLTGLSGGATLYFGTDPITTALGVGNIVLYAGAYTFLKPRSEWNTWVGAIVGAVPPVMGYTAATHGVGIWDVEAALLGGTLFLWQFPHFFALSWMHRADYARGGFQMVATNDTAKGCATADLITKYTLYLSTMPIISTLSGVTSSMFAIEGLFLNGYALYVANKFNQERSNGSARKVFLTSLWYLPCWMILFLIHSKKWREGIDGEESIDDELILILKKKVDDLRQSGRDLCLHEIYAFGKDDKGHVNSGVASSTDTLDGNKCPVVLGKETVKQASQVGLKQTTDSFEKSPEC